MALTKFQNLKFDHSQPPYIVAEAGTSHGGDLTKGLALVEAAAQAGADAIKVQVIFADEILPPEAGVVPLPGGPVRLYDTFKALERGPDFYMTIAEHARKLDIEFSGSPFGLRSMDVLQDIGVDFWKVASPELNHLPLISRLARSGLPIVLSTGVSQEDDIQRALDTIADENAQLPVILLHCITSYPAPENQANLLAIQAKQSRFQCPVGFSDHSLDPVFLPILATQMGACIIEKHLTLNRDSGNLDDKIALNPRDFQTMCQSVRDSFDGLKDRDLTKTFGKQRIRNALGSAQIGVQEIEKSLYGRTNRTLHAIGALKAGTIVTQENTAILRTEKELNPGVWPFECDKVYGKTLIRDISSGDGITFADIEVSNHE